jgi:hypothetical protein
MGRSRPLRILFTTHTGIETALRETFAGSQHWIVFGDLTKLNVSDFDLIVPLTVPAVLELAALGRRAAHNLLPVPSAEVVQLCDDKLRLNRRLIDAGFARHVPDMLTEPRLPCFIKKRVADSSVECYLVEDEEHLRRLAHLASNPAYFCQAVAQGDTEYATHLIFDGTRIVCEITVEYVSQRRAFIKGRESFLTTDVRQCHDPRLFENMLRSIDFRGLCCINYKAVDGEVQILEINPRFGNSLASWFFAMVRHLTALRSGAQRTPNQDARPQSQLDFLPSGFRR